MSLPPETIAPVFVSDPDEKSIHIPIFISSKFHPWKSGDKVWLEGRNLKLCYPSKKLASRREGPFEIVQVIFPVVYKL